MTPAHLEAVQLQSGPDSVTAAGVSHPNSYLEHMTTASEGTIGAEAEGRAYAEDMGFIYCETCGAVVIPDGSDDPMAEHAASSHGE